jgi:hypothetical protein
LCMFATCGQLRTPATCTTSSKEHANSHTVGVGTVKADVHAFCAAGMCRPGFWQHGGYWQHGPGILQARLPASGPDYAPQCHMTYMGCNMDATLGSVQHMLQGSCLSHQTQFLLGARAVAHPRAGYTVCVCFGGSGVPCDWPAVLQSTFRWYESAQQQAWCSTELSVVLGIGSMQH